MLKRGYFVPQMGENCQKEYGVQQHQQLYSTTCARNNTSRAKRRMVNNNSNNNIQQLFRWRTTHPSGKGYTKDNLDNMIV